MPIFCVKFVKIYTGQKKFTRMPSVASVTNIRYGSFETLRFIVKSNFWNIWQKSRPRKITLQYIVKSSNYNAANTDSLRSHNAVGIYDSGLGHSHNLIAVSATHTLTQDARIPMHESKFSFSNCSDCSSSPAGVSLLKNSPQRTNDFIGGL